MDRFGLSYELLDERFPRLVYTCIRGFGDPRTGRSPFPGWPAFDIIAQTMGGVMSVTGFDANHLFQVGPGIGDIFPGRAGSSRSPRGGSTWRGEWREAAGASRCITLCCR